MASVSERLVLVAAAISASVGNVATAAIVDCNGEGPCTAAHVRETCTEFADLVGDEAIEAACTNPFGDLAGNHYQFDKNFMDGGTLWNDRMESDVEEVDIAQARIFRAHNITAATGRIAWPAYEALEPYVEGTEREPVMSNFNAEECSINAAVCCFRMTGDDDDSDAGANAEACAVDHHPARRSNHVYRGFSNYEDGDGTYPQAYCRGFAWGPEEDANAYGGNALFHISYLDAVANGRRKNLPGAPMCACLDQMPILTEASCVQVTATGETFSLEATSSDEGGETDVMTVTVAEANAQVTFAPCGEGRNLREEIESKYADDTDVLEAVAARLVGDGNCPAARDSFLNEKFWGPAEEVTPTVPARFLNVDSFLWTKWAGQGMHFRPVFRTKDAMDDHDYTEIEAELLGLLDESPNKIVRRTCDMCVESHRDIYYKRLAYPLEDGYQLSKTLLGRWTQENNAFQVDFQLFSTYQDAVDGTNPWQKCNWHGNVGLPFQCGPTEFVDRQWISYERSMHNEAYHHAFYVEMV